MPETIIAAVLISLHLILFFLISRLKQRGTLKIDTFPLAIVFFLPFVGEAMVYCLYYQEKRGIRHSKEVELEKLKLQDIKYRQVPVDDDGMRQVVPLEEALVVNDSGMRRNLMMGVLHKDPEQFLDVLKSATGSEDTEVTHYATTTLLEIQNEYEQEIQRCAAEYEKYSADAGKLVAYIDILQRYIGKNLISGNALRMQRLSLKQALTELLQDSPEDKKYIWMYVENAMAVQDYEDAARMLEAKRARCGDDEKWYMLYVEYCWSTGRSKEIATLLKEVSDKNIYLTRAGREWLEFWNNGDVK